MRLLYVRGYNGNPYGDSYKNLKNACKEKHELFTIDYNPELPMESIKEIRKFIKDNKIDTVIGASLGGFLTMNLYGISRIVVNPCWDPAKELPKIGYTGDREVYMKMLVDLTNSLDFEEKNLCSGVFTTEDELLGTKYLNVFKEYFANTSIIKGGHRISMEMANYIINTILPMHDASVNEFVTKLNGIDNAPWL